MHLNYHIINIHHNDCSSYIILVTDRYIRWILIKLRILYIFRKPFWKYRRVITLGEYRIFTSIPFVSMTSSPRSSYVCTLRVCAWDPGQIWRIPVEPLACTRVTRYMRSVTDLCTHRAYHEYLRMYGDTIKGAQGDKFSGSCERTRFCDVFGNN